MRQSFQNYLMVSVAAASLTGCTLGPDFLRPTPPGITGYTAQPLPPETASADTIAGDAQRFLQDTDVPGRWWTLFRSPVLDGLVEQALRANPDIDAAQASSGRRMRIIWRRKARSFPRSTAPAPWGVSN